MSDAPEVNDFLLILMAAFGKAVEEKLQFKALHESYRTRLWQFMQSETEIKEAKLGNDSASLAFSLRTDPSFKHRLQEALRGHAGRLVQEAHEFCLEVAEQVYKELGTDTKLILLADSLEHIQVIGADANLFAQNAHRLMLPGLHVVYSLPPYVIPLQPNIVRVPEQHGRRGTGAWRLGGRGVSPPGSVGHQPPVGGAHANNGSVV